MPLSDMLVRNAKPGSRPRKLFDERGLFLLVNPNGRRWWRTVGGAESSRAAEGNRCDLGTHDQSRPGAPAQIAHKPEPVDANQSDRVPSFHP